MLAMSAAEVTQFLKREFPQIDHLDLRIEELSDGRARLRLPRHESQIRPGGTVSGPTMMTLADTSMYALLLGMLGPVALAVTTSLSINFLRRPEPADLLSEVKLLKLGRRLAVGEVTIYCGGLEPVAHAVATYSIPPRDEAT
jgi:uncharacterized protein (TIGR00369 family)